MILTTRSAVCHPCLTRISISVLISCKHATRRGATFFSSTLPGRYGTHAPTPRGVCLTRPGKTLDHRLNAPEPAAERVRRCLSQAAIPCATLIARHLKHATLPPSFYEARWCNRAHGANQSSRSIHASRTIGTTAYAQCLPPPQPCSRSWRCSPRRNGASSSRMRIPPTKTSGLPEPSLNEKAPQSCEDP